MILTCPECAIRYKANADAIGPQGRTVRCASCSATWFVKAEPDMPSEALDISSQPDAIGGLAKTGAVAVAATTNLATGLNETANDSASKITDAGAHAANAIRDKADRKKVARRIFGVSMIWVVTLAILILAATLTYVFRQHIVERFPGAATVYKGFNIEVAEGGLVFGDVVTRSVYIDGALTVLIEGQVKNPDRSAHTANLVRLSLHNPDGTELAAWTEGLEQPALQPGNSVRFVSQFSAPPPDATELKYSFTQTPLAAQTPQSESSDIAPANIMSVQN